MRLRDSSLRRADLDTTDWERSTPARPVHRDVEMTRPVDPMNPSAGSHPDEDEPVRPGEVLVLFSPDRKVKP